MIECSGFRCPGNNWFHLECIDMDEDDVPEEADYFCSEGCEKRHAYRYCCNVDLGDNEPMIACDNPACLKEWVHYKCAKLKKAPRKLFCHSFNVCLILSFVLNVSSNFLQSTQIIHS